MKKRYFWGAFLLFAAVFIVISQMGYLPDVGVFSLLGTVGCIAIIIYSIPSGSFGGILFPLAVIGILYDDQLGITAITPWTILLTALLGTIGLNLIFSPLKSKYRFGKKYKENLERRQEFGDESGESVNGENVWLKSNFGSLIRYVTSEDLRYVSLDSSFSGVKIYLDNARVPAGNVTFDINSSFSGVELYVPKNWEINNHIHSAFGAVDQKNKSNEEKNVTLTLEGENTFGGITIFYV